MKAREATDIRKIMLSLTRHLTSDLNTLSQASDSLSLPLIKPRDISEILEKVETVFKSESVMLELASPIIVVGDLHGHLLDLFRIFNIYGKPSTTKYLFLGDIVDRGEFSLETITMILLAKILFPKNVL